ncbi:Gfo/Idh/MocA family protein [Streptomyces sp. NBC_00059]|uniref:Gfo/Idh/MocA family protein n=1 Tax=Streptomyces sp. NBC_00059 TaxID=2975635 RepID=UPI00225A54AB|nr:Gfo/Idh/MocA family oxidoreductase [Streptomyces sp. NBC_00059]MCX5414098.1 Gfo/Idh/MocA family oxidoreductase [Streptomyces sp. NBC_00059]
MSEIRLGLIGAGAVGALHAEAAAATSGLRVTAVCDLVADTARALADPSGADVHTDHRKLIASGAVDAVVVNTPHALHTGIVTDCAAAGLHVLVEKPMATTAEDCAIMERACRDADVVLFVGHIQHFLPPMAAAKAALDAGAIGPLLAVSDWRSTDYRPGSRPSWFFDPAVSGGGVFMNIGAHCVDRLLWLTGRRAVAVAATAGHRLKAGVETDVLARLELEGGLTGHIGVTSTGLPTRDELVLIGERGAIRVARGAGAELYPDDCPDDSGQPGGFGTPVVLAEESADDVPRAFRTELAAFAAAVRGEQPPAVTAEHGRRVIEVIEGVYESFGSGRRIVLGAEPAVVTA